MYISIIKQPSSTLVNLTFNWNLTLNYSNKIFSELLIIFFGLFTFLIKIKPLLVYNLWYMRTQKKIKKAMTLLCKRMTEVM